MLEERRLIKMLAPGRKTTEQMQPERLTHFKQILIAELGKHTEHVREDQAAALELSDDGVKDTVDMSLMDVNKELALRLGERESQMIADIDQALLRIEEGSYGTCARCGKLIDERRLEALPTARYDANCQAIIEAANGEDEHATL
jgi:DnaK suppressor protein